MTKGIRKDLYKAIISKHAGWFDLPENNIGTLTSTLTSDVYALKGASTEGLSTIIETWIGLIGGVIMALIIEWRLALSALGVIPFFV